MVTVTGEDLIKRAQTQKGKPYIYAFEVDLDDPDPEAFDCSELIQWVCHQEGIYLPDGAIYQMRHCRNKGSLIPISQATKTRGALLFRISPNGNHVAFSLGNGVTFEARGKAYGVGSWTAYGRGWTHAAKIPGVKYQEV